MERDSEKVIAFRAKQGIVPDRTMTFSSAERLLPDHLKTEDSDRCWKTNA